MTGRNHHSVGMGVTCEMSTPGARLPRLPAGQRRHHRADPQRQRLLHGGGRQVAPDPAGGGEPLGPVPAVADGRGLRLLLRVHGRGDEPLVPAALPGPLRRSSPTGSPRTATTSPRTSSTTPSPGSRTSRRSRPSGRSSPTSRSAPRTRRSTSRRSGGTSTPAGSTPAGTPSASRRWRARRSSASCPSRPSWPRGPRASRTGTSSTRPRSGSPPASWRPTPASPSTPTSRSAGSSTPSRSMGVLDDTLFFYLLGDNGASGEGGPRGTFREHLVGHGIQDDTADMAARLDTLGDATTYAIYPVGWALAMNTPYPWTKQVAHLGGTRDGMIVRWGNGIAARGEIRHQWHHVIDVLPTILEAAGLAAPETVGGVDQQPIEGTSLRYTFDDAEAAGPAHHAVLRDDRQPRHLPRGLDGGDPPRHPVGDGGHAQAPLRRGRLGALRPRATTGARPTTSPRSTPTGCASCRSCSGGGREAPRVPPRRPGHRAREPRGRRPARPAPRADHAVLRTSGRPAHRGGRPQRQEPLARDHRRPRGGHRHQRRGRRAGRALRWLVALRRRRRPALRLQLRRPRPDRRARR